MTFKHFQGVLSAAAGTLYQNLSTPLQNKTNTEQQDRKREARQETEQLPNVLLHFGF
jgi:hypothetical protein